MAEWYNKHSLFGFGTLDDSGKCLISYFVDITFSRIYRECNLEVDRLSKKGIDDLNENCIMKSS